VGIVTLSGDGYLVALPWKNISIITGTEATNCHFVTLKKQVAVKEERKHLNKNLLFLLHVFGSS
jgi:hypothetical protein